MEHKPKQIFRRPALYVVIVIAISTVSLTVYALDTLWSTESTVTIASSSPFLKVYYTANGAEVSSLNLGSFIPGSRIDVQLRIYNTNPTETITFRWNSTLPDVTNEISDSWMGTRGVTLYTLGPSGYMYADYIVNVASDCPYGTYSWTLYLLGPN